MLELVTSFERTVCEPCPPGSP